MVSVPLPKRVFFCSGEDKIEQQIPKIRAKKFKPLEYFVRNRSRFIGDVVNHAGSEF